MDNIDIIILSIVVTILYIGFAFTIYQSIKNAHEEN